MSLLNCFHPKKITLRQSRTAHLLRHDAEKREHLTENSKTFIEEARSLARINGGRELFTKLRNGMAIRHSDTPDRGEFFSGARYRAFFKVALELDPKQALEALQERQSIKRKTSDLLGVVVEECRKEALQAVYGRAKSPMGIIDKIRSKLFRS